MATFNKRLREPPSVPFLWEERPGIPKKDWKPTFSSSSVPPTPPVKLIASVPFLWEEKPGTPLPYFAESSQESATPLPLLITYPSPPLCDDSKGNDDGEDEIQSVLELDLEAFDFETDDSFSSAPSLLANCLVSSLEISNAVPDETETDTPSSPLSETGSSTSSYATGASSLVGGAFLEWLFPLLPAKAGFLEKVGQSDNRTLTPQASVTKYFDRESNSSIFLRPRTLGELILMSRKSSYRRKAVHMRHQNLSKERMMKEAFSKMIERLHRKKKNLLRILM